MADPIGLASALVSLVQLTVEIISYVKDVKDAPRDMMDIFEELSGLRTLLVVLNNRVDEAKNGDPWLASVMALGAPRGPLDQFREKLQHLTSKIKTTEGAARVHQLLTWKFNKQGVKETLSIVERIKTYIGLALQNDHFTLSQAIKTKLDGMNLGISLIRENQKEQEAQRKQLESNISKVATRQEFQILRSNSILGSVLNIASAQDAQEILSIGEWLSKFSKINFWTTQHEHFSAKIPGTGAWLLGAKEFKQWQSGATNVLWCPGDPGVGKTILASTVVNHLFELSQDERNSIAVACIYFSYEHTKDQTSHSLAANLLRQLFQYRHHSSPSISSLYSRHKGSSQPSFPELKNVLEMEIGFYSTVFIIIDALDECPEDDGVRTKILNLLSGLPPSVHILVTSRDIPEIGQSFQWDTRLTIKADIKDLEAYVRSRLTTEKRLTRLTKGDSVMSQNIIEKVTENAEGMFLLARLHMDALATKTNRKALLDSLTSLPKEVDSTYDEAMQRIDRQSQDDRDLANQIFIWLTYAVWPLNVEELQHALLVMSDITELDKDAIVDEDILLSVCTGLVVIDDGSRTIRLVHYTTQEYFEKIRGTRWPDAEFQITDACLNYLSFCVPPGGNFMDTDELRACKEENPFFKYAAEHWGIHGKGPKCAHIISNFLSSPNMLGAVQSLLNGLHLLDHSSSIPEGFGAIHAAAVFGLDHLICHLLENDAHPNARDSKGRTAIFYAAGRGNDAFVKKMLEIDGIDADLTDWMGSSPLSYAASEGHEEIVRLLLSQKDVDGDSISMGKRTPLSLAAEEHHEGIVKFLLARGDVNVNSRDSEGRTPLSHAAAEGSVSLVSLFLARADVDVEEKDKEGKTPLFWAAEEGNSAVVKLLLQHPAVQASRRSNDGETPLSLAAQSGDIDTVRLLVSLPSVQLNAKNEMGETPLAIAANFGHKSVMALLLEQDGTDADAKDSSGRTPLSLAAENGSEDVDCVTQFLTRSDVVVNSLDQDGRSPLSYAAGGGKALALERLLEHDRDIDTKDKYGRTPLSHAASTSIETVRLLLDQHVTIDSKDNSGRSPLSYAAEDDNVEIVALLLERGSIVATSADNSGRTPLSYASESYTGTAKVADLLLQQADVDPDFPDSRGKTPLSYAVSGGNVEAARLLLSRNNVEVDSMDSQNRTLLSHAAEATEVEPVELLLRRGAKVDAMDKSGRMPISYASEYGQVAIMKLLLDYDYASLDMKDRSGRTALSYAASSGKAAGVKLLLEKDADPNTIDNNERTPLSHAASAYEAVATVKTLLAIEGIDPAAEDKNGVTPLWYAVGEDSPDIVRLLLETGKANPGKITNRGSNALSKAAASGLHATIELLLAHGDIEVNFRDPKNGNTALLLAALNGHFSVVECLLARSDIDVNLANNSKQTPLMCAAGNGHTRIVKQLLGHVGIDITAKSKNGNTALTMAKRSGHKLVEDAINKFNTR